MSTRTIPQNEKTAQFLWTGLILMFFLIQAIIWTFAISITSRDSSHAVVSDYDEQALNWDEVQRQRALSESLGWNSEIRVDPTGDIRGNRVVTLVLKDHDEQPVDNATVSLKAFHRGRAAEVQFVTLEPKGAGVFTTTLQIRHSGQWLFSGTAIAGENQFLFEQQLELDSNRNL